jgi:hypothetical protein
MSQRTHIGNNHPLKHSDPDIFHHLQADFLKLSGITDSAF